MTKFKYDHTPPLNNSNFKETFSSSKTSPLQVDTFHIVRQAEDRKYLEDNQPEPSTGCAATLDGACFPSPPLSSPVSIQSERSLRASTPRPSYCAFGVTPASRRNSFTSNIVDVDADLKSTESFRRKKSSRNSTSTPRMTRRTGSLDRAASRSSQRRRSMSSMNRANSSADISAYGCGQAARNLQIVASIILLVASLIMIGTGAGLMGFYRVHLLDVLSAHFLVVPLLLLVGGLYSFFTATFGFYASLKEDSCLVMLVHICGSWPLHIYRFNIKQTSLCGPSNPYKILESKTRNFSQ